MKNKINKAWRFLVDKTLEERQNLHDCKKEVDNKNRQILSTMLFAVILIFSFSFITSFFSDFFLTAGVPKLRWAYLIVAIVSLIIFIIINFLSTKAITPMIYAVNTAAFIYSFIISAYIAPDQICVTFTIVLFMTSTLYLDYGWRIHFYMLLVTLAYVYGISHFKPLEVYSAEAMNSYIIMSLLFIIGSIVRHAGLGIFVARNTLQKYAYTDQLTNVHNRRKLFEDFAKIEENYEDKRFTVLAILDIDYFKKYNDTYGHSAGDRCLEVLGKCLNDIENKYEAYCYRYGGEEFAIGFIGYTMEQAINCIEELKKSIYDLNIKNKNSEFHRITVSVGVADVNTEGVPKHEAALSRADSVLYEAKKSGRNTIKCTTEQLNDNSMIRDTIRKRDK